MESYSSNRLAGKIQTNVVGYILCFSLCSLLFWFFCCVDVCTYIRCVSTRNEHKFELGLAIERSASASSRTSLLYLIFQLFWYIFSYIIYIYYNNIWYILFSYIFSFIPALTLSVTYAIFYHSLILDLWQEYRVARIFDFLKKRTRRTMMTINFRLFSKFAGFTCSFQFHVRCNPLFHRLFDC